MSVPKVLVLLVRPVPLVLLVTLLVSLVVPEVLSVPEVTFFAPVNLSIANLVPTPRAAPANALVNLLPVEPEVLVPVVTGIFVPVVLAAPVPVEVKVLPVVPVVLEVRLGNLDVVPAVLVAVVAAGFAAVAALVPAVEPFRADVTAVLG